MSVVGGGNPALEQEPGDDFVTGVRAAESATGGKAGRSVDAGFIAIGHAPNTELVEDRLEVRDAGSVPGRAGRDEDFRGGWLRLRRRSCDPLSWQAVTAAGTGCMAAAEVQRGLAKRSLT